MTRDWKMELYWRMPVRFQETILSLYARHLDRIYYGPGYREAKEWCAGWKNWSLDYIEQYKTNRLQHVIRTAIEYVPYYREKFRDLNWKSIREEADLVNLPLLEKQSIRQRERNFVSEKLDIKSLWVEKTSGSTGTALKIYWPMEMVSQWWAIVEVMIRGVAGVSQEMPRAMMGGRSIVKGNTDHPPYWRYNRRWSQLYLSSYHVSRKTARDYLAAFRKYGSQWLTGYGSSIAALADSALEEGLESYPLKAVIVSGDTLLPGMRQSIEKFFQCKCYDQYGQCEGVAMAMECSYGNMHTIPTVGVIEILREDGSPCRPGEVGEIVATGLLNDAMPLIRYRIGDYGALSEKKDCPCGNPNPIITSLEGRVDDYLLMANGKKVGRLAAFRRSPSIHSAQLVQDNPDHAYLLVRPGEGYLQLHATAIRNDIIERIGEFKIDIVEVREIPKTPQGKTKLIVRLNERPEMREIYEPIFRGGCGG